MKENYFEAEYLTDLLGDMRDWIDKIENNINISGIVMNVDGQQNNYSATIYYYDNDSGEKK
jgi:hypothetical protein